jgi:hypothetical protein
MRLPTIRIFAKAWPGKNLFSVPGNPSRQMPQNQPVQQMGRTLLIAVAYFFVRVTLPAQGAPLSRVPLFGQDANPTLLQQLKKMKSFFAAGTTQSISDRKTMRIFGPPVSAMGGYSAGRSMPVAR